MAEQDAIYPPPEDPIVVDVVIFNVRIEEKGSIHQPAKVYTIDVNRKKTIWTETYGSEAEKNAFIRGVEAAASMCGFFGVKITTRNEEHILKVVPKQD